MNLNVLQERWLMLAAFGGAALVLLMALSYLALWRPRQGRETVPPGQAADDRTAAPAAHGFIPWLRSFMPWVLVLTYVGIALWAVLYTVAKMRHPPNW